MKRIKEKERKLTIRKNLYSFASAAAGAGAASDTTPAPHLCEAPFFSIKKSYRLTEAIRVQYTIHPRMYRSKRRVGYSKRRSTKTSHRKTKH